MVILPCRLLEVGRSMRFMDSDIMHDSVAGPEKRPQTGFLDSIRLCHPGTSAHQEHKTPNTHDGAHRIDDLVGNPFHKTFLAASWGSRSFDSLVSHADGHLIF